MARTSLEGTFITLTMSYTGGWMDDCVTGTLLKKSGRSTERTRYVRTYEGCDVMRMLHPSQAQLCV